VDTCLLSLYGSYGAIKKIIIIIVITLPISDFSPNVTLGSPSTEMGEPSFPVLGPIRNAPISYVVCKVQICVQAFAREVGVQSGTRTGDAKLVSLAVQAVSGVTRNL
jgi:hypothetical protein